ncbi:MULTISPECIES: hypothetical protein [unclassified Micromonospora]|uniref:hypothetical protein n=1 Tax=unclassified Micromonospora TaxID=2617518 RepID=UPI003401846D
MIELLLQPSRRLPVVVVSSTNDGSPEARFATVLASRLAGLAHVVLLDTWLALDSLNAQHLSRVPLRGARLFWPSAAGAARDPWWTSLSLKDARDVSDRIFGMLSRLSVVANPRDHLAEAVRAAERMSVREETQRRIQAAAASGDLQRLIDELKSQVKEEQEWSAALVDINAELERENRDLRTYKENFEALTRWSEATSTEMEPALEELQVSPDFRELWPALETESDGALVFTESAKESWIDSGYPYPDRMRKALEALARAALSWRAAGGRLGKSMVTWMTEEFGLTYAPDDEGMRRRKIDTFTFGERTLSRLPHVKIDDYVQPDRVGRIYFAIDESANRWIVDHVGIKLGL